MTRALPFPRHIAAALSTPTPRPHRQILLMNSKFHEGVSVWEALGISEGRLGNLPAASIGTSASSNGNPVGSLPVMGVAVPAAGGEGGGGSSGGDGTVVVSAGKRDSPLNEKKTGGERFTAFFESVLGLAMGDWPPTAKGADEGGHEQGIKNDAGKGDVVDDGGGSGGGGTKDGGREQEGGAEEGGGSVDVDEPAGKDNGDAMDEGDDEEEEAAGRSETETPSAAEEGENASSGISCSEKGISKKEKKEKGRGEGLDPPPAKVARREGVGKKGRSGGGGGGKKKGEFKKRKPRRSGWEGLSIHERIAYVMFLVNVFQVSIFVCVKCIVPLRAGSGSAL